MLLNYMTGLQLSTLYRCIVDIQMYGDLWTYWGIQTYGAIQMYGGVYRCMVGIQTYGGCRDVWGAYRCIGTYGHMGGIWMYGVYGHIRAYRCMGITDIWGCIDLGVYGCMGIYRHIGVYRHMGAYGCTCLLTIPEGICKMFSFPLIISHVHHLSTEMEVIKPRKMPECMPIYINPNYQTK